MEVDKDALQIINMLEKHGYKAYIVGGCTRDFLMNIQPFDWDITTDATPKEVMAIFRHVIETGLKHGTVTVVVNKKTFEVTTFRSEDKYSDLRHPDSVEFSKDIKEDLSRRDFTMNAIAYNGNEFIDEFDGREDIKRKLIRCVGDPFERFKEDALRILRALRFSSTLGFRIENKTYIAMNKYRHNLNKISVERVYIEISKMLAGSNIEKVLNENFEILSVILPEIIPMKGCKQNHPCHIYDVWEHTVKVVSSIQVPLFCDKTSARLQRLRLAALLHDIGKPSTKTLNEENVNLFYSHNSFSKEMAREIFNRLNVDNATKDYVCTLIKYHDMVLENRDAVLKRWMNKLTPEGLLDLIELKIADTKGQAPNLQYRIKEHRLMQERVVQLIEEKSCFSLKDLEVKGGDLIGLGLKAGPKIGETLNYLLNEVIEGRLKNSKEDLLKATKDREIK